MKIGSRVAWTAAAVGLVIGIPVGALCAGALRGSSAPLDDAIAPRAPRAAPADAAPTGDPSALRAELDRLRDELAARTQESARVAVEPLGARALEASAAHAGAVGTDELARLIESGALYAAFSADADGTGEFLFQTYMRAGLPQDALRVLRAHDLPAESSAEVAQALLAAGDRAGASEALVLGLERHAEDFDWRDPRWGPNLERHDPAGALAALERWKARHGDEPDARMDTRRAALLARLGRGEEARGLLDWVWRNSEPNELAWRTLGDVDPKLAESRMLATLAGDGVRDWENQARYMGFLRDQGRGEELTRAASAWLEREDVDYREGADFLLAERPALYADALQRRLSALSTDRSAAPDLFAQLALAQERLGDRAGAYESCLRALADNPFHDQAASWLMERDPSRYFATAEETVRRWNDDGAWGSLGDQYLAAGRRDDARRAFEEARRIAPDDDEWNQRIAMANAGLSPHNWAPQIWSSQGLPGSVFMLGGQQVKLSNGAIFKTK
ncbi:MAG: hypothetical protein EPO68_01650 [Planctomycetota bacterium]|nr:MAG: hypothetical protein EPO68_01650 [Planctomycetota bacterium]